MVDTFRSVAGRLVCLLLPRQPAIQVIEVADPWLVPLQAIVLPALLVSASDIVMAGHRPLSWPAILLVALFLHDDFVLTASH